MHTAQCKAKIKMEVKIKEMELSIIPFNMPLKYKSNGGVNFYFIVVMILFLMWKCDGKCTVVSVHCVFFPAFIRFKLLNLSDNLKLGEIRGRFKN